MDIAKMIKQVARGRHGAENLTMADAEQVFAALLGANADPLQLGAFLIGLRMKGETADELAGFVRATRSRLSDFGRVNVDGCVDLPCYAGKRRAAHAALAAAMRARDAGIPVFVHGVDAIDGRVTAGQVLQQAGVQRVVTLNDTASVLQSDGIVYADLSDLSPDLFRLYLLRERLGVRTCVNTIARLLNPMQCSGQLNGFFHTPYADYMAKANILLGQPRSLIFMGAEGEPELYADRQKLIVRQQGGDLCHVKYARAGAEAYPRQPVDLERLRRQSASMLAGVYDSREHAVIQRMSEAFAWAGRGRWPDNWEEER